MWSGIRAPTPLVKGGGWGSPLQLLDCALLNTGSASCVHAHTHSHVTRIHTGAPHAHIQGTLVHTTPCQSHACGSHVHTCTHMHACAHACLHNVIHVCTHTCLFSGTCVYLCAHVRAHIHTDTCAYTNTQMHASTCTFTRAHTHTHSRSAPASAGLGTVDKQRLVPTPCLLAWPCIPYHTGLPHLDAQPACPSSSHAALWPPFRMGCPAGQGSSSQRDTLETGLHGSGRGLGHASRGPGSWNGGRV